MELRRDHKPCYGRVVVHRLRDLGVLGLGDVRVGLGRRVQHEGVHVWIVIPGHAAVRASVADRVVLCPVIRRNVVGGVELLPDREWPAVRRCLRDAVPVAIQPLKLVELIDVRDADGVQRNPDLRQVVLQ